MSSACSSSSAASSSTGGGPSSPPSRSAYWNSFPCRILHPLHRLGLRVSELPLPRHLRLPGFPRGAASSGRCSSPWSAPVPHLLLLFLSARAGGADRPDGDHRDERREPGRDLLPPRPSFYYRNAADIAEAALEREYERLRASSATSCRRRSPGSSRGGGTIADRFEGCTVIFADMVGFTGIAEKLEPEALVGILNSIFSFRRHRRSARPREDQDDRRLLHDRLRPARGETRPRRGRRRMRPRRCGDGGAAGGTRARPPYPDSINSGPVVAGVIEESSPTTPGAAA